MSKTNLSTAILPLGNTAVAGQKAALSLDQGKTVVLLSKDEELTTRLRLILGGRDLAVKSYATAIAILTATPPFGPACIVIDQNIEAGGGLLLHEQLRAMGWRTSVIFLVSSLDVRMAVHAMRSGADDILVNSWDRDEILAVIDRALDESSNQFQRQGQTSELLSRAAQLTLREREIVKLVVAGLLNKQIAGQLQVALVTVKVHRASAMRKLGARNAAELSQLAIAANIV